MAAYKKFLVKQQHYNGVAYVDVSSVVDTYTSYKIVCQEFPFKVMPETKDVVTRDWHDEDGEDVYIPQDGLRLKAYDLPVKFLYSYSDPDGYESASTSLSYSDWLATQMRADIVDFINFLRGSDESQSIMLAIYDEYSQVGFQGVYVSEISEDLYEYFDSSFGVHAIFTVKFRITDPATLLGANFYQV